MVTSTSLGHLFVAKMKKKNIIFKSNCDDREIMKQLSGGDNLGGMAQNLQGMPHQFFLVDIGIKQGQGEITQ